MKTQKMDFSQCVEAGLKILNHPHYKQWKHLTSNIYVRVARKVLRDDGEINPPKGLVEPLVEELRQQYVHEPFDV